MNWFTNHHNTVVRDVMDRCEHLKDGDTAFKVTYERDSFGPVGAWARCKECYDKEQEEQTEYCHDCGQEKPVKEIMNWTPYDYYPPQGDEPIKVCEECRGKEKHKERCRRDDEAWERENSY